MDFEKKEKAFQEKMKNLPAVTVPLFLNSKEELIKTQNLAGPEAFTLCDEVAEYLETAAEKITLKNRIKIEIHFRNEGDKPDCEKIIKDFYSEKMDKYISEHIKNSKRWRIRFFVGFVFFAACHLLSLYFSTMGDAGLLKLLQDSLEIMGWVAIWEPTTYFLFDRREEGLTISDYFQLKNAEIEVASI